MIVGVGIDLIEVERVGRSESRFGDRFLRRIYHPRELEQTRGERVQYLAARFAVKEATFKALGTGWAAGVRWVDVETRNLESGQPVLHLHGAARERAERLGAARYHVSITHTAGQAAAVVVLETAAATESTGE
ncbi:MAG: holo-ACP synthase [Candidatus Eisenbacteria bacterium]|nr:holo-ACP synthase [Candidatus Latescibacterota bacterium]MBD3303192.1 holo-ACP synthase [Candidatus Eisenbacteria bacterium]